MEISLAQARFGFDVVAQELLHELMLTLTSCQLCVPHVSNVTYVP